MLHAVMNGTLLKFGYPHNVLCDYRYWTVLLRPEQVTLGSLILGNKGDQTAFSMIEKAAMQELHTVVGELESTLKAEFDYDKMNYLMLMMVDPHVHFHVIPRYSKPIEFDANLFEDFGWPGPPQLQKINSLGDDGRNNLISRLKNSWSS